MSHLPIGLHGGSSKQYQRQCIVIHNRMKNRDQKLQGLKQHLKQGTFPKYMKSLKPYPIMETPEAQALVNEACQQVEKVMLNQRIQDYERKLQQDRAGLQTLKETRREQRQKLNATAKASSKKVTVSQLQQELRDLQAKYTELSQKLIKPKSKES